MIFTNQELGAILKVATIIAGVDGNVAEEEKVLMAVELMRFIGKEAANLNLTEACVIISKMTNDEKKYVTAYFGTMICADGNIEESELKVWSLISSICNLPKMSIDEAIEIITNL